MTARRNPFATLFAALFVWLTSVGSMSSVHVQERRLMPAGGESVATITSAVPAFLSYQGRVTTPAGALVGAGTPVNRTVTFRIWSHATNSLESLLVYSEQQVATISEGEFSVLIGQGNATAIYGRPVFARQYQASLAYRW